MGEPSYCSNVKFDKFVDSSISDAHEFYRSLIDKNNLEKVMKTSDTYSWSDYGESIFNAVIPWIAFAAIAFIIFILAIVIRCIKAVCCKSKIKDRTNTIKNVGISLFVIIAFLSMGCCAYIIHYGDSTYQGYMQLQCTSGRIPYGLLEGNHGEDWIGLLKAYNSLEEVADIVNENYTMLTNNLWYNTEWLQNDPNDFGTALGLYYYNFKDSTVYSPNPLNSANVSLSYIKNLGSPEDDGTYTYMINYEYQTRIYYIYVIFDYYKTADLYSITEIDSFIDGINSAKSSLTEFIKGNREVNDHIENWIVDNHSKAKNGWRFFTLVQVLIGWFVCVGILVVISAQALNQPKLAHGLCIYWVLCGFFSVLGFILCISLLSIGIVSNDSCGLVDSLMTPDGLKEYTEVIPEYIYEYMNICLNGNGDLDTVLELNTTFDYYTQLLANESVIYNQLGINTSLDNFESISTNWDQIQSLWTYTDIVDEDTEETPEYNLAELNKFSDSSASSSYQSTCTTKTLDQWVFNSTKCTRTLVNPTSPTSNLGKNSCLVIPQWTSATLTARYENYLQCTYTNSLGNVFNNILAYQSALNNFQSSTNTLAQELTGGLQQVNDTILVSVNHLIEQKENIHQYFYSPQQLGEIYTLVYGKEGLLYTLNCKFVRSYVKTLKKSVCDNNRESIYQVFIFLFVLSILMILLEFLALYLSRALLKPDESMLRSQLTN